ncbi:MAG: phosphoenolpyruvate--protein phosphotransferase [Rhabdochlamydiaceae bacterium]|nr:phosphoenolpyruvate--protein phosphotransferase [Rhabdochlamydiaceae bacterium]
MNRANKEIRIKGFPVSDGVAIGVPYFFCPEEEQIPEFPISIGEVDDEIARYRKALFSSREDLQRLQSDLVCEGSDDAVTILDTHIQMLEDPMMTTHMEEKIRQMLQNTESVFHEVIRDYEVRFSQTSDSFFQQRLVDVMDLAKRVLGHLSPKAKHSLLDIPFNSIVFIHELIPSYTAAAQTSRVSAFVSYAGGGNSHAALIARAKGIPFVACIDIYALKKISSQCVIVDGQTGEVIFNPTEETLSAYKRRKTCLKTSYQLLQNELQYDTETIDGFPVQVFANIGHIEDLEPLKQGGVDGIGLFRSEFLFFHNQNLHVSEEQQFHVYRELIEKMPQLPVSIRVFDVGGDKHPEGISQAHKEPNPVLGCRGIRFLLRNPELFRTQLRALHRASAFGNLQLLLPLISDIRELQQARTMIDEVASELKSYGVPIKEKIPVGVMIEVPSAVIMCDALVQQSDFLAIGTNDLLQFTLGIDRGLPSMSEACYPAHPSIVRMIKMVLTEAKRYHRPVSICGEIASSPLFVPLLLGLGADAFSCSPRYVPLVKRAVRQSSLLFSCELAQRVLQLSSPLEVSQVLLDAYNQLR